MGYSPWAFKNQTQQRLNNQPPLKSYIIIVHCPKKKKEEVDTGIQFT